MMDLQSRKADSILLFYQELYRKKQITKTHLLEKLQEYQQILRSKVLQFNHQNSTSISLENYERIRNALDYLFFHSTMTTDINGTLHEHLDRGKEKIEQDLCHIETLIQQLLHLPFPFLNDAYHDVLHASASFLKNWKQADGWLSYPEMTEDLLYPLIDGLPLYHDLYQLKGTDLVMYYLERLHTESMFCNTFASDLPRFYEHFSETRELPIKELLINLSDLLIHQCIIAQILHGTNQILLTSVDQQRFQHLIETQQLDQNQIHSAFIAVFKQMPGQVQTYFYSYADWILHADLSHSMICHQEQALLPIIRIKKYGRIQSLSAVLDHLYTLPSIHKQTAFIQKLDMGIYDWIDLLDQWLLTEEELQFLFHSMDEISIQILWEALKKEYMTDSIFELEHIAQNEDIRWLSVFTACLRQQRSNWLHKPNVRYDFT